MSAQRSVTTVTQMRCAPILLEATPASVSKVSEVTANFVVMSTSAVKRRMIVTRMPCVLTQKVATCANAKQASEVLTALCALISMSVQRRNPIVPTTRHVETVRVTSGVSAIRAELAPHAQMMKMSARGANSHAPSTRLAKTSCLPATRVYAKKDTKKTAATASRLMNA